ncbi:MAG: sigma-70 family RNA polymerase sigma factor [Planctomycetes bacterium]|nr:sigma-70 family RNA polymerase sigma factor [Planctomycetota bacterium]
MPASPTTAAREPEGDSPSSADLALADRLRRRAPGAAEELLERHLDPLYAFVHFRVGGDRHRAEDLVQETFLTALERIAGYDARASLHAWLCGIARNKLRSERRRARPRSLEDALEAADPEIDLILSEVARTPLPDAVLERRETRELVGATLSSLPLAYRESLLAKYVDGLSVAEIAARSAKSEKAAESTLTRARVAFARVFELLAKKRGGVA